MRTEEPYPVPAPLGAGSGIDVQTNVIHLTKMVEALVDDDVSCSSGINGASMTP